jgi:hypothetical protein
LWWLEPFDLSNITHFLTQSFPHFFHFHTQSQELGSLYPPECASHLGRSQEILFLDDTGSAAKAGYTIELLESQAFSNATSKEFKSEVMVASNRTPKSKNNKVGGDGFYIDIDNDEMQLNSAECVPHQCVPHSLISSS